MKLICDFMGRSNNPVEFIIPPKNSLKPNGHGDPLLNYYHPIFCSAFKKRISQAIPLLNKRYGSILELGYGSGIMMPTLCSMGRSVKGIDLESDCNEVLSNLKKLNCKPDLINGRAEKMPYLDNSFDLVVAISIMEHIKNFEDVIDEVSRVLKPGGHFLVGMPKVNNSMSRIFKYAMDYNIDKYHITRPDDFKRVCKEKFNLLKDTHIPSQLPRFFGFYFNMLFEKPKKKHKL